MNIFSSLFALPPYFSVSVSVSIYRLTAVSHFATEGLQGIFFVVLCLLNFPLRYSFIIQLSSPWLICSRCNYELPSLFLLVLCMCVGVVVIVFVVVSMSLLPFFVSLCVVLTFQNDGTKNGCIVAFYQPFHTNIKYTTPILASIQWYVNFIVCTMNVGTTVNACLPASPSACSCGVVIILFCIFRWR